MNQRETTDQGHHTVCLAIENEVLGMGSAQALRSMGYNVKEFKRNTANLTHLFVESKARVVIVDWDKAAVLSLARELANVMFSPAIVCVNLSPDNELLEAGILSYITLPFSTEILRIGIQAAEERSLFCQATHLRVSNAPEPGSLPDESVSVDSATYSALSSREMEILHCLSSGLNNKEVAEQLCLSVATVKSHSQHILRKLKLKNRTELVSMYLQSNAETKSAGRI